MPDDALPFIAQSDVIPVPDVTEPLLKSDRQSAEIVLPSKPPVIWIFGAYRRHVDSPPENYG